MDLVEVGGLLGASLGAAAASFVASWAAFARPLKKQINEAAAAPAPKLPEPEVSGKDLDDLKQEHRHTIEKLEARVNANETRLNNCVTSDEFSAYTGHTTQSINQLTEKVGRVTGVLEAWARQK